MYILQTSTLTLKNFIPVRIHSLAHFTLHLYTHCLYLSVYEHLLDVYTADKYLDSEELHTHQQTDDTLVGQLRLFTCP